MDEVCSGTFVAGCTEREGREHAAAFYELLGHKGLGVMELRALGPHGPRVAYVRDHKSFVELAFAANGKGANVYVGLQPRPSAFFGRAPDSWRVARGGRTEGNVARAGDIEVVCALALDIDVATDARVGRPATEEELAPCIGVGRQLLALEGFAGSAALAVTGNGVHVIAPITPVLVEAGTAAALRALEEQLIASLHSLPPGVRVDRINDLTRIVRVPGTMNFKGMACRGRPHRRASFLETPAIGGRSILLAEQLRELAQCAGLQPSSHRGGKRVRGDLQRFRACEYLRWIEDEPTTIPEPAWMEFLVQCSSLVGGEALAHEISSLDSARYASAQTQARLDRIRARAYQPRLCERLPGPNGDFRCPRLRSCAAHRPYELAAIPHNQESMPMNDEAKKQPGRLPKYVARCGAISATVWPTTRTVEGELREYFTIEIVKNYRDASGTWRKTSRFWPDDLPAVIAVSQAVYRALRIRESWPASEADESGTPFAEAASYVAEEIIPEEGGDEPEEG